MARASVVAAVVVGGVSCLVAPLVGAARTAEATDQTPTTCAPMPQGRGERAFDVSGRIRMLLFWTGRRNVGAARMTWAADADGARRLALLIGTDPDRAPRRLNRWGYEEDRVCGPEGASLLGVMTAANERTLDDATAKDDTAATPVARYRAMRETVSSGESRAEILPLSVGPSVTYRDVRSLVARLPPPGPGRRASVPAGADAGLLSAVERLMCQTVAEYRGARHISTPARRVYIYAGRVYDLTLTHAATHDALTVGRTSYRDTIEASFEIRNRTTNETTDFQLDYGTTDGAVQMPIRLRYQPRWWLSLELTPADTGADDVVADSRP